MSTKQSRRLARVGAILAIALTLSACTATSASPESTGQDLVIGLPNASIANLDPFGANPLVQGNLQVNKQIFDTLVVLEDGEFSPGLATEWTSNEDATVWTFTLRGDVTFSDGTPLDAEDVKASLERIIELEGPLAGIFRPVTAEATSETEVVFSSEVGQGALLGKLSMLAVGPSELLGSDEFGLTPVGTGPFILESFDPSTGVTLTANEDYWAGAPKLDSVTFKMIPEQAARTTALETGEIQLTWTVPDDAVEALESNPDLVVESTPTLANLVIWFNSSLDFFADSNVRRALWQAVDYQTIIDSLYPNTGEAMTGPLPGDVFGASEQEPYEFDPEAATSALEAAGWDFNRTIRVLMTSNTYQPFVEAVISDWAKIGVKAEVDLQEAAVGTQRLLDLDWDLVIVQPVITSTGDADYNLGRLYTCEANRTGYCDEKLDSPLIAAGQASDQDMRRDLYAEAGQIVWDDAVGMFPMNVRQVWAWNSNLEGVALDPVYKPDLTQIQFKE